MMTLWKEWRQQRGLVTLGICAGIIWPLIGVGVNYSTRKVLFTDWGSGIVAGGGAVFAVFLAMATGYADLRQGVDAFWQTRPIRIGRVFLVKLLVGMVLLAVTFAVIMVPDVWTGILGENQGTSFVWSAFWTTWPIAVLLFGAGLFFVALIRDTAKAAFVTIWFGLLVYFLPLFFNGLRPLNVFERLPWSAYNNDSEFLREMIRAAHAAWSQGIAASVQLLKNILLWYVLGEFLYIMLGGALAFTLLAIQAVRRNWRWQPGQKTIVWTLGASAALIFAMTVLQVRSDLELASDKDGQTLVNPMTLEWVEPPLPRIVTDRRFRLFRSGIPGGFVHRGYLYTLEDAYDARAEGKTRGERHCVLQVYRFPTGQDATRGPSFHCGGLVVCSMTGVGPYGPWPIRGSYAWGDRLYVAYPHSPVGCPDDKLMTYVATVDISNPGQPRLIGTIEIKMVGSGFVGHGDHAYIIGSNQWAVLSLKEPDLPVVAAQWTFKPMDRHVSPQLPRHLSEGPPAFLSGISHSQVVGDCIVCTDRYAFTMTELSEPNDPVLVCSEDLQGLDRIWGDTYISGAAIDQGCLYLSTKEGLIVRRLIRHADGHLSTERIGYRAATPLERLSGRNVSEILLYHGYLIESDRDFGLLAYDISNPSRPRRVMHSDLCSGGIGIWNGLLYSLGHDNQLNLFDLPARGQ